MEVEKGSKANKNLIKNSKTLKELEEESPELAAKYRKLQEEAIKYVDRMKSLN
jgi:predicted transcriptional regulator